MLREQAHLAGIGRSQVQRQAIHDDGPRPGLHAGTAPAAVAIEAEIRTSPGLGMSSRTGCARMGSIHQPFAEAFQTRSIAEVDQLRRPEFRHDAMMRPCRLGRCRSGQVAI